MITKIEDGKHDISLDGVCPHCGQDVRLTVPQERAAMAMVLILAELLGINWKMIEEEKNDDSE